MNFLFGGESGKSSVVDHAQRVVAELEVTLNSKNEHIADLEKKMEEVSEMCVSFIEMDIARLALRRREILKELSHVEAAMQERAATMQRVKTSLGIKSTEAHLKLKQSGSSEVTVQSTEQLTTSTEDDSRKDANSRDPTKQPDLKEIEEEIPLQDSFSDFLRREVGNLLFSVDRSDADEVVAYLLPEHPTSEIVTANRAIVIDDTLSITRIGGYEWMLAYGAKVVPNHEREEPETIELPKIGCVAGDPLGLLVGAIEIPCAPDVIIDIWKTEENGGSMWATTSIEGVQFCTLQRISLKSETHWGLSSVVQIDLHGKHPFTGDRLVEIMDMGASD